MVLFDYPITIIRLSLLQTYYDKFVTEMWIANRYLNNLVQSFQSECPKVKKVQNFLFLIFAARDVDWRCWH